jgi:GNAT superfamily N-acetyltransferase
MATDYQIRAMTSNDIEAILDLLQISLNTPGIPRTKEFWIWKHIQNPFGASPGLVAEANNRIIGLRVFLLWKWKSGNVEISAARAVDTVVHPQWRGKGVFSRLTSTLLEDLGSRGVHFIFNTPNVASKKGYLKLGWQVVRRLPLLFRPLKPFRIARNFILKSSGESVTYGNVETEPPGTDLWKNLPGCATDQDLRLHTIRNKEFMTWRYQNIPGFHYEIRYRQRENIATIGIFRQKIRKGLRELSISEFSITSGSKDLRCAKELLDDVLKTAQGDYAVAIAAKNTPEYITLRNSGFFPLWNGPILVVKKLREIPTGIDLMNWNHWRCSIGDLEIF